LDYLQKKAKAIKTAKAKLRLGKKVAKELANHTINCAGRNKDKITKRYLTVLGNLCVPVGLSDAEFIYASEPSLRQNELRYLSSLPFSSTLAKTFLALHDRTEQYDDVTRFAYASALVDWAIPHNAAGIAFAKKVEPRLSSVSTPFEWLCWIVFLAKYGPPHAIMKAVQDGKKLASIEPFIARQGMAVLPRCLGIDPKGVLKEWRAETAAGYPDSASVASNLLKFSREPFPVRKSRLHPYLFPERKPRRYPLAKFLLLCTVAHSEAAKGSTACRPIVAEYLTCPWYVHWANGIHGYWLAE
jgi:hypothetical protein